MPATKVETGVYIELKRLRLTAIARKHRAEKTASLAKSLKEGGTQLAEIVVCPHDEAAGAASEYFDVLAGVGRKEAEESLGWEKGRCTIMYGLSPYEKLKTTLDENEERQPTGPLDDARIYNAMMKAGEGITQEKLAERLGIKRSTLADYLSLMSLPAPVQDFVVQTTKLGLAHLLQICRLKTPEAQIELAKKADEEGWTAGKLKAAVNKRLGKDASPPTPLPQGEGGQRPGEAPAVADPLASLWPTLRDKVSSTCRETWAVAYTPFTFTHMKEWGWAFGIINKDGVSPRRLAAWLEQLAKGIRESNPPDPEEQASNDTEAEALKQMETIQKLQAKVTEAAQRAQEMYKKNKATNPKAADHWLPRTPEEFKDMEASPMNYRLPSNLEEWAEIEALAPSGPGAVYQWMLGASSYWTKKAAQLTWQDLGYPDPHAGCRRLIDTLRQGKSTPPTAPKAAVHS